MSAGRVSVPVDAGDRAGPTTVDQVPKAVGGDRVGRAPARVEFAEAMSRLAAGLAVVTARDPAAGPRGLLVSSLTSYSLEPPSVLVTVDRRSRSFRAVTEGVAFGVHLLADRHAGVAERFAGRSVDKFAGLDWAWDGDVPRLAGVPVYLRCAPARVFTHGDHAIVIGETTSLRLAPGDPLVYYDRRYDWRLAGPG